MRYRTALVLVCMTFVAAAVGAQGSWSARTNAGEYAFARGDLDRAEIEFQAALEIAQTLPAGDLRLETSLENLARLYEHESDFDRAQPMYQLLLAATEERLGETHAALLDTLFAVARVSQPTGDLPTVTEALERYATIADASGKAEPRKHWQALQMLATMQTIQEDPESALGWQRRAAEVIADDGSATVAEKASVLESLAEMELVAGNGPTAERIYVAIAEIRKEEDEADAFPQTTAMGAETAFAAGELETAERLAMRSVNAYPDQATELIARTVLAELGWIKVNRGTDDMTMLLDAAGDSEDLTRARDRLRSLSVLEDGTNPSTLTRLAQVEALRGQPASAADWQQQLLDLLPAGSEAAADAHRNFVALLAAAGRYDQALEENAKVLAGLETQYGPSDKRLMPVLGQRLELCESAGDKKQAKKIRKRMKKISRQ